MTSRRRGSTSAPPGFLEPVLRPVERLERRLRHIRPIRPGGVLSIETELHRGPAVVLADGTPVRVGDPVAVIHFDNVRVHAVAESGWQLAGIREARADFRALATWAEERPRAARPVAYRAETVLGPLARWAGFEIREPPHDAMHRLRAWYMRGLLARWARDGRARLRRGHAELRLVEIWLSAAELQRRFGRHAGATPDTPGARHL